MILCSSVGFDSPVRLRPAPTAGQPDRSPALKALYEGFQQALVGPLGTEMGDLMPAHPRRGPSAPVALGGAAGAGPGRGTVPVGRGGERRAIALANPGLAGAPFATPTLWAAIQYLNPREDAPEHRHTQNAFRFVVEGEGVWTVAGGDPVAMRRGDFLPQAGWNWHAHHNATTEPMAWIDGLDIPFQYLAETSRFLRARPRHDQRRQQIQPDRSRAERLWGYPGLQPVTAQALMRPARRCWPTGGNIPTVRWPISSLSRQRGSAVRSSRVTPRSAWPDPPRAPMSCPPSGPRCTASQAGGEEPPIRETGSSVYQVFDGSGAVTVGDKTWTVSRGDLFVVPSWQPFSAHSEAGPSDSDSGALDLFRFSDSPVFEALQLGRTHVEGTTR